MKTKIILFNGPPGSGKDTLAHALQKYQGGEVVKFAQPLKDAVPAFYGISKEEFEFMDSNVEEKCKPRDCFLGLSCREVQIAFSETYGKPMHGEEFFGKILVAKLKSEVIPAWTRYVSDSGFRQEAEQLVNEFGAETVFLVRIHRDGTTFEGDSRNYINLDDLGVKSLDLDNNGTIAEACKTIEKWSNNNEYK